MRRDDENLQIQSRAWTERGAGSRVAGCEAGVAAAVLGGESGKGVLI